MPRRSATSWAIPAAATPTAGSAIRRPRPSGPPTPNWPAASSARRSSSGMGAIHAAIASRVRSGDRIVASRDLYGSTRSLLLGTFGGFGVQVDLVDVTDLDAVAAALAARPTAVLYAESIANPTTVVADHARLAELAHRHGAAYLVDNTFASPYVCRPLDLGADLVIESATKFLGGHSDVIAGRRRRFGRGHGRGRPGPGRDRRDPGPARGVPRPARDPDPRRPRGATLADRGGPRRLAGDAARRRAPSATRASPAIRSTTWRSASSVPVRSGGCSPSTSPAGATPARRSSTRCRLPELTASLGSVHTMVVHPPSTSQRQLSDAALRGGRDHGGPVARLGRVGRPGGSAGGLLGGP